MRNGGMIGYVLDGRCDDAINLVEQNIRSRQADLRIGTQESFNKSRFRPNNALIRETNHDLDDSRRFLLHHLFLPGVVNEGPPTTTGDASLRPFSNR